MRFIPNILRPARPTYTTKITTPEETKLPETPLPDPIQLQTCAYCGGPCSAQQPHRITNGDLYLKRFPYTFLCNECWRLREQLRTRHNIANKRTLEEQQAVKCVIPTRPQQQAPGRKPSMPLEMEDLAQLRLDDMPDGDLLSFSEAANYVGVSWITFRALCRERGILPNETNSYRKADMDPLRREAMGE